MTIDSKRGGFRHVSVTVTDLAAAKRFYGEQLGFPELPRPDFDFPGAWYSLGGELQLHLIVNEELVRPEAERASFTVKYPHFAIAADDVDATAEALSRRGVKVREHSTPGTGFRQLFVKDPDGNMVEFIGPM